jgi:hypothetical protein
LTGYLYGLERSGQKWDDREICHLRDGHRFLQMVVLSNHLQKCTIFTCGFLRQPFTKIAYLCKGQPLAKTISFFQTVETCFCAIGFIDGIDFRAYW